MDRLDDLKRLIRTQKMSQVYKPAMLQAILKRGVFRSIVDLQAAINRFLTEHNTQPKPFTWTADPDKIIAAVKRGHQTLESIH